MKTAGLRASIALLALFLTQVQAQGRRPTEKLTAVPVGMTNTYLNEVTFGLPLGIFFDPRAQELFLADTKNHRIAIFDPDGMPKFTFGPEAGLDEPRRVMVDEHGRIYVLGRSPHILVFSYRGEPLGPFPFVDATGEVEVGPLAMTIAPDGRLLFADQRQGRILVYNADWSFLRSFGSAGEGRGEFVAPVGLAVGPEDEIYVTDRLGIPVQVFSSEGRLLRAWGKYDMGAPNFAAASGIAVDREGRVFVSDILRQDVKVFSSDGTFLFHFGGLGSRPGEVAYPSDVAIGPDRLVYVCEKQGRRIQWFRIEASEAEAGAGSTPRRGAG